MKNLIITIGIIMLMTMGNVYQQDCDRVARAARLMKSTAREMSSAVMELKETGIEDENCINAAENIMKYNLKLGNDFLPLGSRSPFEGKLSYDIESAEKSVEVSIRASIFCNFSSNFNQIGLEICARSI